MNLPQPEATDDDLEALADIIWWIKGFHAASEDSSDLTSAHIEALRRFRMDFRAFKVWRERFAEELAEGWKNKLLDAHITKATKKERKSR